jgi:hypothetical protein
MDTETEYLSALNQMVAELREPDRALRIKARQSAMRQAWRTGKGPQLNMMERLAVLKQIAEMTP